MDALQFYVNESLSYSPEPSNFIHPNLYMKHTLQSLDENELLSAKSLLAYGPQSMSHSTLDGFLVALYFRHKEYGILHLGGRMSDDALPADNFIPIFKPPKNLKDLKSYERSCKAGRTNGITFVLDAETYDFTHSESLSQGFTVGIKHHLDFPTTQLHGIDISPGYLTMIEVSSERIKTNETVRTRFDPEGTQCYFDGEIKLDHFPESEFRYSMINCLVEVYIQQVDRLCNCTMMFAPNVSPVEFSKCNHDVSQCIWKLDLTMGKHQKVISEGKEMQCLSACNDQTFSTSYSTSKYPNLNTFHDHGGEFCLVMHKVRRACKTFKRLSLVEKYEGICDHFPGMNPDFLELPCDMWDHESRKVMYKIIK